MEEVIKVRREQIEEENVCELGRVKEAELEE